MSVRVRIALGLAVLASLMVLALPRTRIAPLGILNPAPWVIGAEVAAIALLLVGVALSTPAGPHGAATLGVVLAAAMAAGAAVGSIGVPDVASSVAWLVALALALAPALIQLSLAWPAGEPTRLVERRLVLATWLVVALLGVARLLVWDPFADATCVLGCRSNPLSLASDPRLARALLEALLLSTAAACLASVALVLRRRRFWIGGLACMVLAIDATVRLATDEPLPQALAIGLHQARFLSLALVGAALITTAWSRFRRHGRLLALAADLDASPAPGTYEASLRAALGDPSLQIAYPAADEPIAPAQRGLATTTLVRSDAAVAIITHRPQHADALAAALGPAARMAIDNERLASQLRARLDELRASRERIVERGDTERLRLERDLHDGAQQRLLMIGYELQQAAAADPRLASELEPLVREVQVGLDELRSIAHGIYPGILESLGLAAALDALADGPVPFCLEACPDRRLPAPIERAVYRVVSSALKHPQRDAVGLPTAMSARVELHSDALHLWVEGFDAVPATLAQKWEDRIGALGGTIRPYRSGVECVLPCG